MIGPRACVVPDSYVKCCKAKEDEVIEVKLACDSVMVMSKQGRLNGKTEQEVGESEGSERWRGARAEEGDDGCENQKIKEVSPCPREESRECRCPLDGHYGMNPLS